MKIRVQEPSSRQARLITSWNLPVPPSTKEAKAVIGYILNEGPEEEVGDRVNELRECVTRWQNKDVCVRESPSYFGIVARLRARTIEERGYILASVEVVPTLYVAIVIDKDGKEHNVPFSKLRLVSVSRSSEKQLLLF